MPTTNTSRIIAGLVALVSILAGSLAVRAQVIRLGGDVPPPVSSREVERYADLLRLSDAQREAVLDLHAGLVEEHLEIATGRNEAMDDLTAEARETGDHRLLMEEMPAIRRSYNESVERVERRFFEDLRLLLRAEQEERWPKLERLRRRLETIGLGTLSGESVDLIEVTDRMELSAETRSGLAAVLERYEKAIDRALTEREEQRKAATFDLPRGEGFEIDMEAMLEQREKLREASEQVREVNRTYARQIAGVLPESKRETFERRLREASFPRVYRESYTGTIIGTAEAFEDLSPEQRAQIDAMREAYERELDAVNDEWAEAIATAEVEGGGERAINFAGGPGGGMMLVTGPGETEEIADARSARRDLDRRYLSRVRDLLSTEQRARLPRRSEVQPAPSVGGGGGEMMRFEMIVDDDGPADVNEEAERR